MQQRILDTIRTPSLPTIVARLNALLDDPEVGTPEIGAAIAEDPSIAAMVLRVANSSAYGLREPVVDIQRAAVVLGVRQLSSIVLRVAVIRQFAHLPPSADLDLIELWKHSILTAQLAQALGRKARAPLVLAPEELYTCGLLHDLGKVVLYDNFGERYLDVVRDARERDRPLWQSELEEFEFSHPQVGGVVAFLWSLGSDLEAAIDLHHGTPAEIRTDAAVSITALADRIANRVQAGTLPSLEQLARHPGVELSGIPRGGLELVLEEAVEAYPAIEV